MNFEDLKVWRDGVCHLLDELDKLVDTRNDFISLMKEHIDQCFSGYRSVGFKTDLTEITINYPKNVNPVIKPETIHKLGMDWIIKAGYDDEAYRIVVIKLYPFGVEEGMVIED